VSLTDAERGQLVAIWLLGGDHDGVIPASPDLIQKLCYMSKSPNLNKFIELGFLTPNGCQDGVNLASTWRQLVTPKAETEADKNKEKKNIIPSNSVFGEFKNVKLTEQEHEKLETAFGKPTTDKLINSLSEYIASKGKQYKSHYATILQWARKEGKSYGKPGNSGGDDNLFLRSLRESDERKTSG
jgi:hypothetical protein